MIDIYQDPIKYKGRSRQIPEMAVIHCMGEYILHKGRIYSAKEWLEFLGYAAHITITPSGVVCQHLDFNIIGAHAFNHNTGTIGIEFLLAGVWTDGPFRERIKSPYLYDEQYSSGILTCRKLSELGINTFKLHSEIDDRIENGRKVKVDPGDGFPKDKFMYEISC